MQFLAEGVSSCRQWLKDNYTGYRGPGGAQWADLWSVASSEDIALGQCGSEPEMITLLNNDDRLEVALRHLGAHFYESRTRDKVGASHMRAFATPGTTRDVIPSWLVSEASTFSKSEYQRNERVESEIKRRGKGTGKGEGKDEAKGKFGKKKE